MKYVPAWCESIVKAGKQWVADDANLMAAAVSYYAALSLFPLLLVLTAGLGWLMQSTSWGVDAETTILNVVEENASSSVRNSVASMLDQVKTKAGIGGPLGLLGLVVGAATLFAQFEKAFDKIWQVQEADSGGLLQAVKDFAWQRGRAFLMVAGLGVLLLLNVVAGIALSSVRTFADSTLPGVDWIWKIVQLAVSLGLNSTLFGILFWQLPKADVRFHRALRGGVLTAVAWSLGQGLLTTIVVGDRFSAYGVIGSFLAVLVWIYYAACVLFLGAEYVQVISHGDQPLRPGRR